MSARFMEIINTFTPETYDGAIKVCKEKGYDINRGVMPLDLGFELLRTFRKTLKKLIDEDKFKNIPNTLKANLEGQLETISRQLTSLINGADEVQNLSASIEQLNILFWQYNLLPLARNITDFKAKYDELAKLETGIKNTIVEILKGTEAKAQLDQHLLDASSKVQSIQTELNSATATKKQTEEILGLINEANQKSTAALASVQQNFANTTQLQANTTAASAEVTASLVLLC